LRVRLAARRPGCSRRHSVRRMVDGRRLDSNAGSGRRPCDRVEDESKKPSALPAKHCLVSPQPVRARLLHEGPTRPRMSLAPINQSLVTMESLPASPWHGSQLMMVCPVDHVGTRFNGHRLLAALKSYGRPRRSNRMHTAGRGVHELRMQCTTDGRGSGIPCPRSMYSWPPRGGTRVWAWCPHSATRLH
jgi:hypothetical protein